MGICFNKQNLLRGISHLCEEEHRVYACTILTLTVAALADQQSPVSQSQTETHTSALGLSHRPGDYKH
jgi:hypothetical protein